MNNTDTNRQQANAIKAAMKAKLESIDLPAREIKVLTHTIIITAHGEAAAREWASILSKFSKVQGVGPGWEEPIGKRPFKVWRVMSQMA